MLDLINNSQHKEIRFPKEEYIKHFGKEPNAFSLDTALEHAVGAFCALLKASEVYQNTINPNWEKPQCDFIYALDKFEIDYLKSLASEQLNKTIKDKSINTDFNDSRGLSGAIKVNIAFDNDKKPEDLKLKISVKLELTNPYKASPRQFSSINELNSKLSQEIKDLHSALWPQIFKSLNPAKKFVRKTIDFIPQYLHFAALEPSSIFDNKPDNSYVQALKEIKDQIFALEDLTLDVLFGIIHLWVAKNTNSYEPILVSVDDLLYLRGLKPAKNSTGYRGGFKDERRKEICRHIELLGNLSLEINSINDTLSAKSKILNISKWELNNTNLNADYYFLVTPGDVLRLLLTNESYGYLNKKTLEYDTYRCVWEKRISRFLHWNWITLKNTGQYLDPIEVKALVNIAYKDTTKKSASIRNRFEKAMDRLLEDGVISAWQYSKLDEDDFFSRTWLDNWLKARIIVEPPTEILQKYSDKKLIEKSNTSEIEQNIDIDKILQLIKKKNITQLILSELINIPPSSLSKILSGKAKPTRENFNKLAQWVLDNN